jgi:hypothetical protein
MVHREMGTVVTTVYQVETTYPGSDPDKFGTYYAYAYTDVRDPGREAAKMLVNTMPELFGHDVRTGRDGLTYRTPETALAAAAFLNEHGRMTSGWEHHGADRRGPIKARVVEIHTIVSRRLVTRL